MAALNQGIKALIVGLSSRSQNIIHPLIVTSLSAVGNCKAPAVGLRLLQELGRSSVTWRGIMKALIAALALVTLLASPTFAQTAPTANSPTCGGYGWGPSSPCYGE
jgi:hypothetical protein